MKKGYLFLAALACLCWLTACGGETEAPASYETSAVQKLAEAGTFSEELEEVDADTAFLLYRLGDYGLEREDLTDCAVLRSAGATCEEGAVLVLSGEEQAGKARQALEDYVAAQIESNTDYRPAEIPKLESAQISLAGNTLLLAVVSDSEAAAAALGGS